MSSDEEDHSSSEESEEAEELITDLSNSDVVTKYQEAAKIVNLTLKGLTLKCKPGVGTLLLSSVRAYVRVRPFVRPSVRPSSSSKLCVCSVGWFVGWSDDWIVTSMRVATHTMYTPNDDQSSF